MKKSLQVLSCLAMLAAPLATMPARAETSGEMQWRAQHEDMESIRVEREQLESQADRLRMECMDAKGQDRSSCEEQSKALHERREALHQKMEALHDKREYQREERHDHKKKMKDEKKGHKDGWKKKHADHHAKQASKPTHPAPAPEAAPTDDSAQ